MVADYIFHLPYDFESLADSEVAKKILHGIQIPIRPGRALDKKWFLYHEDARSPKNVALILEDKEAELSSTGTTSSRSRLFTATMLS